MYIDECPHSFEHLTKEILPIYMQKLHIKLETPFCAKKFSLSGKGPVAIANELNLKGDFSGCYVLIEEGRPIYVGISRSVLARLRQHFTGKTHFDASLVYAMTQRKTPTPGKRQDVMMLPKFKAAFLEVQAYLCSLQVAFIEIDNPLELYIFEAYAAVKLSTHQWNTFRTH